MYQFKTIQVHKVLKETARSFFVVRKDGVLSNFFKYLLACIYPAQNWFDSFDSWRVIKQKIAYCKWQKGQLTNFLNWYFSETTFDIEQARLASLFCPTIDLESSVFLPEISSESTIFTYSINDPLTIIAEVTIKTPNNIYIDSNKLSELTSLIEQIKLDGSIYKIESL